MESAPAAPRPIEIGRRFFQGAALILLLTGLAKLVSIFGTAEVYEILDPIFILKFRYVLAGAGLLELAIAAVLLRGSDWRIKAWLTLCLACGFAVYRVGLIMMGFGNLCPCLGSVAMSLGIPDGVANGLTFAALLYLLFGSLGLLARCLWWRGRDTGGTTKTSPDNRAKQALANGVLLLTGVNLLGANAPAELEAQFKEHLAHPPTRAEIAFIRVMEFPGEPREEIYLFSRWEPEGYLIRETPTSRLRTPTLTNTGFFTTRYQDTAWTLSQDAQVTNLTTWCRPVNFKGKIPYLHDEHTNSVTEAFFLGVQYLVPGTLQWQGHEFTAKTLVPHRTKGLMDCTVKGSLRVDAQGRPEELRYEFGSGNAKGERRCRYDYSSPVGVAHFPSRIEAEDRYQAGEFIKRSLLIHRVAIFTQSQGHEAFAPGLFYQNNAETMSMVSNDVQYALMENGKWERFRAPKEIIGPEDIPRGSAARWSLLILIFVVLAGVLWLRGHRQPSARN